MGEGLRPFPLVPEVGPQPVLAVLAVEHAGDRWVLDGLVAIVRKQVLLTDISDVAALRILGEQMVERLVLGGPQRLGNGLVPLVAVGEDRVDVEDHAAKVEQAMPDDFANGEAGAGHLDLRCHSRRTLER